MILQDYSYWNIISEILISNNHIIFLLNIYQSYQKRGMYIATQFPLENTANDFWRMVWEKKSNCIVMLVKLNEDAVRTSLNFHPPMQSVIILGSGIFLQRKQVIYSF